MSKVVQGGKDDKQKSSQKKHKSYSNQDSNWGGDVQYDGIFDFEDTVRATIDSPEMLQGPSSSAAVVDPPKAAVSLEDFELLKVLGKGAFAKVSLIRDHCSKKQGKNQKTEKNG